MKVLKLILAVLLLVCLFHMPYGYYEVVRVFAMVGFGAMAYDYFSSGKKDLGVVFAALAVLFQPFVKFYVSRPVWHVVDVVVAILLIALFVWETKKDES